MLKPKPVPWPVGLVVKKDWNILSSTFAGIPLPLSATLISALLPIFFVLTLTSGTNSFLLYFFFICCNIICNGFCFIYISLIKGIFHLRYQFCVHFRKIIDKVQRVLYFMGNTSG